jgi:acyl-CoA reductase-like NAD-dependent aldehyde dehydrogenase
MEPFATELAAARAAQPAWYAVPLRERLRLVRNLRGLIVERVDAMCDVVVADLARDRDEALGTEAIPTASALKFLEKRAAKLLAPRRVSWWDQPTWLMGTRDVVHKRPWGVVGVIGTWNYPIFLNVVQIAQALVAGNTVLWKPSENAPRTAEFTRELFRAAGFPEGVLQTLPATRNGGPRLAETDVDYVVFTGSDFVGRKLATRLGERLIPSTLELSGCDAMFVLDDANVEMAARAAWFGLSLNHGQTCIAVRRVFVARAKQEAFVSALQKVMRGAPLGLVTDGQKTQADRLIADALGRGATVLGDASGVALPTPPAPLPEGRGENEPSESNNAHAPTNSVTPLPSGRGAGGVGRTTDAKHHQPQLAPTFLLNAPPDAAICREACFAPVAAVLPFDTDADAVRMALVSPFALSASVFTADPARAEAIAAQLPTGSVCVNDLLAPTAHPATPFGGRGSSGWGSTQGEEGLLSMTVPQVVTVRKGTFRPHFDDAANPDPATPQMLRGLLALTHARGFWAKWRGFWQLVRAARKKK